jgi:hypothetical protein
MKKTLTKGFCIKLSPEDHQALDRASNMTAQSMSQVVRMLIRAYLVPQIRAGEVFPGMPARAPEQLQFGADQGEAAAPE